jgi:chromosome segregation ATPase
MSENYVNHYVEILTSTMTDAVVRNISLQANARISEEVIADLNRQIEGLTADIGRYENGQSTEIDGLKNSITDHLNTITRLNNEITNLNTMRNEYENVKHQVQHVDTFRNELAKERDLHQKTRNEYDSRISQLNTEFQVKISELNDRIEYLQLTPAKRKKIDDEKAKQAEPILNGVLPIMQEPIKDGGSF